MVDLRRRIRGLLERLRAGDAPLLLAEFGESAASWLAQSEWPLPPRLRPSVTRLGLMLGELARTYRPAPTDVPPPAEVRTALAPALPALAGPMTSTVASGESHADHQRAATARADEGERRIASEETDRVRTSRESAASGGASHGASELSAGSAADAASPADASASSEVVARPAEDAAESVDSRPSDRERTTATSLDAAAETGGERADASAVATEARVEPAIAKRTGGRSKMPRAEEASEGTTPVDDPRAVEAGETTAVRPRARRTRGPEQVAVAPPGPELAANANGADPRASGHAPLRRRTKAAAAPTDEGRARKSTKANARATGGADGASSPPKARRSGAKSGRAVPPKPVTPAPAKAARPSARASHTQLPAVEASTPKVGGKSGATKTERRPAARRARAAGDADKNEKPT